MWKGKPYTFINVSTKLSSIVWLFHVIDTCRYITKVVIKIVHIIYKTHNNWNLFQRQTIWASNDGGHFSKADKKTVKCSPLIQFA